MKRLLTIEWNKIAHYKLAKWFIIIYTVLLILLAVVLSREITLLGLNIHLPELGVFNFPGVWHFITYFAAIGKIFLAIIIITTIANEYSYGTIKQNLIDGLSKKEFIYSKTLTILILSLFSTLLVFIISLVLGLIYSDKNIFFTQELLFIPGYFIKLAAFFSFCMLICFLIRKSALTIALLFVWSIVENIFIVFERFARSGFSPKNIDHSAFYITDYLPLNSMSNLIPEPFKRIKMIDMATMGQLSNDYIKPEFYIVSILYFFLFVYLSYALIKKRDL